MILLENGDSTFRRTAETHHIWAKPHFVSGRMFQWRQNPRTFTTICDDLVGNVNGRFSSTASRLFVLVSAAEKRYSGRC